MTVRIVNGAATGQDPAATVPDVRNLTYFFGFLPGAPVQAAS